MNRLLDVGLGGYAPSWSVVLHSNTLHYVNQGWGEAMNLEVEVSDEMWRDFLERCDRLNIWNWQAEYEPAPENMTTDMASWHVAVQEGERKVEAGGYGAFPETFEAFVQALGKLAGAVEIE